MIYTIYGFYNLVYQILSICFLIYANTFLNGFLIPNNLKWNDDKLRENLTGFIIAETSILVIEAGLLSLIIYYLNKWFLTNVAKASNPIGISYWTSGICGLFTLVFIGVYLCYCFK
jgi:hypothetical protein